MVLCGFLWFYGEAGNRTCDPWFTRHSAYPLHHGGLSHEGIGLPSMLRQPFHGLLNIYNNLNVNVKYNGIETRF